MKSLFTHKYQLLLLTVPVNILSHLGLQIFLFPTYFPEKNCLRISQFFHVCYMLRQTYPVFCLILSIFDEGKNNYTPPQLNLFTAFRLFRPPRSKYRPQHTALSLHKCSFNMSFPVFGTAFNQNPRIISENQTYHSHKTKKNRKQERSDIQ